MNIKKGIRLIAIGFLFTLININVTVNEHVINIMPDFVGWILIGIACTKLGDYVKGKPFYMIGAILLGICNLAIALVTLFLPKMDITIYKTGVSVLTIIYVFALLTLIEKIAGSNPDVADDLISKVAEQKLTRKDLQAGYKATKALREKNGQRAAATSRHDDPLDKLSDDSVTAVQLVMALSSSGNAWLSSLVPADRSKHIRNKYAAFSEFSVRPGTSTHARRIDVVVAETATCSAVDEIHIHGIENKISKADLKGDDKVGEYAAFVDFLWICVPTELVKDARSIVLPEWGILEYTESCTLKIAKHPSKLTAPMREETLVELALRTL